MSVVVVKHCRKKYRAQVNTYTPGEDLTFNERRKTKTIGYFATEGEARQAIRKWWEVNRGEDHQAGRGRPV